MREADLARIEAQLRAGLQQRRSQRLRYVRLLWALLALAVASAAIAAAGSNIHSPNAPASPSSWPRFANGLSALCWLALMLFVLRFYREKIMGVYLYLLAC